MQAAGCRGRGQPHPGSVPLTAIRTYGRPSGLACYRLAPTTRRQRPARGRGATAERDQPQRVAGALPQLDS
jgi:hypothetical protein